MFAELANNKKPKALAYLEISNILLITCSLVLGGGPFNWGWQTIFIVLFGVIQLNIYIYNLWLGTACLPSRRVIAFALMMLALVSLQMIPMPPSLWRALPGSRAREFVLDVFDLGDVWQSISYVPAGTGLVLTLTVIFTSLAFSVSVAEQRAKIHYVLTVISVVGLHCLIGVVQVATGGASLAFFETPHNGNLIGIFANKNHLALAMTSAYIYLMCFILKIRSAKVRFSYSLISFIVFLLLLVLTNSRALIVISFIVMMIVCWDLRGLIKPRSIVMSSAAILTAIAFLFYINPDVLLAFKRFGDVQDDNRVSMLLQSYPLIKSFWLSGSGYGSFAQIFPSFEQLENVNPLYVNHVHNDWVQLLIEGGVGAGIGTVFFAILLIQARYSMNIKNFSRGMIGLDIDDLILYSSILIIYAFIIHSMVDYPFRRGGALVIFVVACGLVVSKIQDRVECRSSV